MGENNCSEDRLWSQTDLGWTLTSHLKPYNIDEDQNSTKNFMYIINLMFLLLNSFPVNKAWGSASVIPVTQRLRQEDHKFEAAWATQSYPVLKYNKKGLRT